METLTSIPSRDLKIPNSKDSSISSSTWYTIRGITWWGRQILQVAFCWRPSQLTAPTISAGLEHLTTSSSFRITSSVHRINLGQSWRTFWQSRGTNPCSPLWCHLRVISRLSASWKMSASGTSNRVYITWTNSRVAKLLLSVRCWAPRRILRIIHTYLRQGPQISIMEVWSVRPSMISLTVKSLKAINTCTNSRACLTTFLSERHAPCVIE